MYTLLTANHLSCEWVADMLLCLVVLCRDRAWQARQVEIEHY